jgi:hypothetical protein
MALLNQDTHNRKLTTILNNIIRNDAKAPRGTNGGLLPFILERLRETFSVLLFCFLPFALLAQQNENDSSESKWSFPLWSEYFIIPNDKNIFNPTFYAKHKSLQLEGDIITKT